MLTVPSCESCRRGSTKDDEYFRTMLVMRDDVGDRTSARPAMAAAMRSLQRRQAAGFRAQLFKGIFPVQRRSPAGLDLGLGAAYVPEDRRLHRVIGRIVTGLYYHYNQRSPLPAEYDVFITPLDERLQRMGAGTVKTVERMLEALGGAAVYPIGDDVFDYRFLTLDGHQHVSAWLLGFYQCVYFLATTLPRSRMTAIAPDSPVRFQPGR
jgi:hypothetical protein